MAMLNNQMVHEPVRCIYDNHHRYWSDVCRLSRLSDFVKVSPCHVADDRPLVNFSLGLL